MHKPLSICVLIFFMLLNNCRSGDDPKKLQVKDRQPAVAGQFYPKDADKLKAAVRFFLKDAVPAGEEKPLAIIVPHAGYIYSGQIAADAFNQARGHDYDVIVLLGTNHTRGEFRKISVFPEAKYITPLGKVDVDKKLAGALLENCGSCEYYPAVHQKEHSIEVQIPFIQQIFPKAKIVPVIIGRPDMELCVSFGKCLGKILKMVNALIVVSSDLSHYPSQEVARATDIETLKDICTLNCDKIQQGMRKHLTKNMEGLSTCACGEGPILAAVTAVKEMGCTEGRIISYANSGQTCIGQNDRVVGYGAVQFCLNRPLKTRELFSMKDDPETDFDLDDDQKRELIKFARKTISQYLKSGTSPLPRSSHKGLNSKCGAFVTLHKSGRLRGCIGHMAEDKPLIQVIGAMALQSAFNDRRFQPLAENELEEVEIEISVLTPYKKIDDEKEIVIGRDGVVLKKGIHSAVYLPQVAPEQGWDVSETLQHLCQKAGLPSDAYKHGAQLYTFQAIVFSEKELHE